MCDAISAPLSRFFATAAGSAGAASWHVEQDGSGDFLDIQPAVDAAASGDTILIGPGVYDEMQDIQPQGAPFTTHIVVYSPPDKSLTYIGVGSGRVIVGPDTYSEYWDGPMGIFHEGQNELNIEGIEFRCLRYAILSYFNLTVCECTFSDNYSGIQMRGNSGRVDGEITNCTFSNDQLFGGGIKVWGGGDLFIRYCEFYKSEFYFDSTLNAAVMDCAFVGYAGQYAGSNGVFADNDISLTDRTIAICNGSQVSMSGNTIVGGDHCLLVCDPNTVVTLSGNVLSGSIESTIWMNSYGSIQGSGNHLLGGSDAPTVELMNYFGYYTASVDQRNNYWGTTDPDEVADMIWDGNDDPTIQMTVDYMPIADGPLPTEETTWGGLKALYRGE